MTWKLKTFLIVTCLAILITSISLFYNHVYYPNKPEDTNTRYWVAERISREELEAAGHTFLPGLFGGDEYLDSDYEPKYETEMGHAGEYQLAVKPDLYTIYEFCGYPDAMSNYAFVSIRTNDPNIMVYGLTINTSREEADAHMKKLGFSIVYREYSYKKYNYDIHVWETITVKKHEGFYKKNHIFIHQTNEELSVGIKTTNVLGIVY